MSVKVTLPWRKTPGRWLVTVYFKFDTGDLVRERTVVGDGTTVPVKTEKQAREWGERQERELYKAGPPPKDRKPEPPSKIPTVEKFGAEWIEKHARGELHKESGIDSQASIIRLHLVPHVGSLRLDQITDEVVASLKAKWIAGGYEYVDQYGGKREVKATTAAKTHNNRLTVLAAMLEKAHEWKRISAIPCRIRMLKVDSGAEADHYDHETYERLVDGASKVDPRVLVAVLLAGDGGLRRGEILAMNLADVDFNAGRFHVRRNVYWRKHEEIVNKPKGGKAKPIPATPRLLAALKAVRHLRGERLLYQDEGTPVTPKVLKMWIQRAEKKANLEQTGRLHIFRHSYASHLAMAGVPARTIQELCRHSSLSITQRYLHLSPSAVDAGIEMLTRSREQGGTPVSGEVPARKDPARQVLPGAGLAGEAPCPPASPGAEERRGTELLLAHPLPTDPQKR